MHFSFGVVLAALFLPSLTVAVSPTDEYQDGDASQSGYLPNHNIDPSQLSVYKQAWISTFNAKEGFTAKPLTYTPNGYTTEMVIVTSNTNVVRVINSATGAILFSRTLDPPFLATDSTCGDIVNSIGIAGTPVIDPATDIMYFFSKGYKNAATGNPNVVNSGAGQYKFYAVNLPSLTDVAGFPISMENRFANNDPTRYFVGGTVLQRPGLAMIGNTIVGAFGGHCDNFNYTGMLVSITKSGVVGGIQAMVASPGAPTPQQLDIYQAGGGKSGIWQSGMGLAVNGNNVYFTTGNGVGPGINKVQGKPNSGKVYLSTLEQVVASFAVDPNTGVLTQQDYFEPANFDTQLNGADKDMSSAGVALLDRNTFKAPGVGINGLAVAAGKNGVVYVLNADNLGGFYNGKNGVADASIQQITVPGSFFGGVVSYPLEGGYIYFCPTGGPLYAYSYGLDGAGNPLFTLAGKAPTTGLACQGMPTVTSFNNQPGTAVVWLADVNQGVLAYNAIPVNGVLQPITLGWATGRLNKFTRTVFGNGRVYTTENNMLYAMAPVGKVSTPSSTPLASTSKPAAASSSKAATSSVIVFSSSVTSKSTSSSAVLSSSSAVLSSSSKTTSSSVGFSSSAPLSSSTSASVIKSTSSSVVVLSSSVPVASTPSTSVIKSTSSSVIVLSSSAPISSSMPSSSVIKVVTSSSTASAPTLSFTPNPAEPAVISTFNYIGCYSDIPDGVTRTLSAKSFAYDPMTLESCAANCAGYNFFGTEYGRECYCGYTLDYTLHAGELTCNAHCSGNATEFCGSAKLLSVYQNQNYFAPPAKPVHQAAVGSYGWIGCYTETTTGPRALSATTFAADSMTVEACVAFCGAYTYAGIEYGRECYCGNVINPTSVLTATTGCSFLCPGNALEYCGAGGKLDMYQLGAVASSSTSAPSSTLISSSKPSTLATSVLSVSSKPASSVATSALSSSSPLTSSAAISSKPSASTTLPSSSTKTSSIVKGTATNAKPITRTFNWNIGWVNASPDGFTRPFVGINNVWPNPPITANVGDTIKINVVNNLGNQTTSIHFHGLFQQNSTFEDGPVGVTQCPIQPGGSFVYQFVLTQSGTYWYHAHIGGQYIDGFRGPITIRDNLALNNYGTFYQEMTLTLSDVYHVEAPYLVNWFLSPNNYANAEPVPDSALINEAQNYQFNILPGKTYLFHIVNMGAIAAHFLQFDQHDMTIVEVDGTYTVPTTVSQIFVAVAQRYSVLVTAKPTKSQNFAIVSQFLTDMFDSSITPDGQQPTATAYLVYDATLPLPAPFTLQPQPWDDSSIVPYDLQPMWDSPNVQYMSVTANIGANDQGSTRAYFNGQTYLGQKVPTLYSALTAPAQYLTNNPEIYGQINAKIVPFNAAPATTIVELTINNHDTRAHPFHLHGHNFQIINRGGLPPQWPSLDSTPAAPIRRDTMVVYPNIGATIRFKADNPGIWLFHCHTEWHVESGMTMTILEGLPELIASKPYIPVSHRAVCDAQGISRKGNAGGNSANWLDLSNSNTEPNLDYYGALITPPASNPYTGGQAKMKRKVSRPLVV